MTAEVEADEPLDWSLLISAMEAVLLLESRFGGITGAKAELADRMRDGILQVYARKAWDSCERDVAAAWEEDPDEGIASYAIEFELTVLPGAWRRSKQWLVDISEWRWPSGRFSTVQRRAPMLRYMFEAIHFQRAEIEALRDGTTHSANHGHERLLKSAAAEDETAGKSAGGKSAKIDLGGRPKDEDRWINFWHCVIKFAKDGLLTDTHFPTKAALNRGIRDEMTTPFSENAIKRKVAQVYKIFIDPRTTLDD
ncbi:hypothetical protein [Sphingomonas sp.]|uniref:hypothetical protein n=1 Tax=Sphingomonas sp. TaxID=28214 RepID=UPI003B3B2E10